MTDVEPRFLTRRRFLAASAVTGAAALLAGSAAVTWEELGRRATTDPLPQGSRVLVLVTLYGGNDGLGTVVPVGDPAYHDARPDLAYTADQVHPLGEGLGLNPAMTGLAAAFGRGSLAVVRGVGYPQPDHSHFRSMDIWQTASPDAPVSTGWVGRWLDATGDDPVRAVNLGAVLPPLAVGARSTAAALPVGPYRALSAGAASVVDGLGVADPADGSAAAAVRASLRAERSVAATFAAPLGSGVDPGEPGATGTGGSAGGQQGLAAQLALVGRCVKAGVPTRVYTASLGGFDTHADERHTQETLLGTFDSAVSGFLTDMAGDPRGRGVVLVAYSEFGRRVRANASQGTDHGTAGPVLVAGAPVRGGLVGEQPSLTDLDDGDLRAHTDFRDVYAGLLTDVLGADPEPVLGAGRTPLHLLA